MPLYDYHCDTCGPFRQFRSISNRFVPADCAACGAKIERVLTAPQLNVMSSNNRIAETRNEKSAHEPGVVNVMKPADEKRPKAPKPLRGHGHAHAHRPWMLGH
ncbi:MAG TPA: zinc ribbon domain-containing protein [Burkholderiales bacterium]|nr:zinc ribbon domain-containing protein [Burkholderiales bacterium]